MNDAQDKFKLIRPVFTPEGNTIRGDVGAAILCNGQRRPSTIRHSTQAA